MNKSSGPAAILKGWRGAALLFLVVPVVLLHGVFLPGHTLFSNDGPLGELMAQCHRLPGRFTGCWADLGLVGLNAGAAPPNFSLTMQWLLGPLWFSRLYAISSLFLLGIGAWCFFRQSRLTPQASVLGGLAAILTSTFFSVACWGMSPHVLAAAMTFFALAALMDTSSRLRWLRVLLAGFAVGLAVAEGADVGALFSLYVAAFIVYQGLTMEGPRIRNLLFGMSRLVMVTLCAAFMACQAIHVLVNTSIKGIAGVSQDTQTKEQRWDWATEWSFQKRETLSFIVPGLFGFRMDTPNGGEYWGKMGRNAAWDRYTANGSQGPRPKGFMRYAGTGYYQGVLVAVISLWAAMQCLRRGDSAFNTGQRKLLWFWLAVSVVSLLLAFGRFGFLYRLLYALPYVSSVRNPVKFLYPFSFAVIVLFGFGVDGLQRKYMSAGALADSRWAGLQSWWKKAVKFEKYWVYGFLLVWAVAIVAWLIYNHEVDKLADYLQSVQVPGDQSAIATIAHYSTRRIGWFLLFFLCSAGLMVLTFSRAFAGQRTRSGIILIGLLMGIDLTLANQPWITYWNVDEKYSSNPILDILRDKPYENRVASPPIHPGPPDNAMGELYRVEWVQQQFPFYNIQSFEMVETPRMPADLAAYGKMWKEAPTNQTYARFDRAWQLTNTRYILAPMVFGRFWNEKQFPDRDWLQVVARFDLVTRPGFVGDSKDPRQLIPILAPNGRFGLLELTNALPRAKLYTQWRVSTNADAVLHDLFDPAFNPQATVLVDGGLPADSVIENTNASTGTSEFVSYESKDMVLKANASAPSVLLLNDHFDPDWKVLVDGKPAELLRCNYVMRGVHLEAGAHVVEFKFQPQFHLIYVSLAAIGCALATLGIFVVVVNKQPAPTPVPTPPAPLVSAMPNPPPRSSTPKAGKGKKAMASRNGKR